VEFVLGHLVAARFNTTEVLAEKIGMSLFTGLWVCHLKGTCSNIWSRNFEKCISPRSRFLAFYSWWKRQTWTTEKSSDDLWAGEWWPLAKLEPTAIATPGSKTPDNFVMKFMRKCALPWIEQGWGREMHISLCDACLRYDVGLQGKWYSNAEFDARKIYILLRWEKVCRGECTGTPPVTGSVIA
jgi:hypothetical protein